MKPLKLLPTLFIAFSPYIWAENPIKPLILFEKAQDSFSKLAPKNISMQRSYQSRSLSRGSLGYGWCLEFDKSLEFSQQGIIQLKSCKTDLSIKFILSRSEGDLLIYKTLNSRSFTLTFKNNVYSIKDSNKTTWDFDSFGRLQSWINNEGEYKLTRDKKTHRTIQLRWNKAPPIYIRWDEEKPLITSISWKSHKIEYEYENYLLKNVTTPLETHAYTYDASHNLIEIKNNAHLVKKISYNLKFDAVTSITTHSLQITYNTLGKIKSLRHPNGDSVVFSYHSTGQLKSFRAWKDINLFNQEDQIKFKKYLNVASSSDKDLMTL